MIIRKYGIELHRLTQEDIELVRIKRNSDAIRQHMFYREIITPEAQKQWFASIRNIYNYYFVIQYKGRKIGLIHGKNIDYEKRTSEGGIFIWDEEHLMSFVPALASITMIEVTFNILSLEATFAEVLSTNTRSKVYNRQLGYILHREDKSVGKEIHVLTRENYLQKGGKIKKAVQDISKDHSPLAWNDLDFSTVTPEEVKLLYEPLPTHIRYEVYKRLPTGLRLSERIIDT
jgi:RimJ/RimL family protein N-acetyltransferase